MWLIYHYLHNKSTFFFVFELLIPFFANEKAHNIIYTSATLPSSSGRNHIGSLFTSEKANGVIYTSATLPSASGRNHIGSLFTN